MNAPQPTSRSAFGSAAVLMAITLISKIIGFAREVILLETVGIGAELDVFLVLFGLATLLTSTLGICIVTSLTPLAREYSGRAGAMVLMRGGVRVGVAAWFAAISVSLTYAVLTSGMESRGLTLALIVPGIVPFAVLAEYQVGLFLARGRRTPVICGNIILSLPLALALLAFDMSIVEYAMGLVLSFALRVAIFGWLLTRQDGNHRHHPTQAVALFGSRLGHTLSGGSAMLAMTAIYVTATIVARHFGEGQASIVGYGLKLPLLVLTSVWFVLGTGFFAAIIGESSPLALKRIRRLTALNSVFFALCVATVLALRTSLPEMLGWSAHSEILIVLRASLPYTPLILLVPTIEMVQRFYATRGRHAVVAFVAGPVLAVGLGLQVLGILVKSFTLVVASPSCAALAGFLTAIHLVRQRDPGPGQTVRSHRVRKRR